MNKSGAALLAIIMFFLGFFLNGWFQAEFGINRPAKDAVKQCEADLSRHLHCEPVYSARVVEPTANNKDGE